MARRIRISRKEKKKKNISPRKGLPEGKKETADFSEPIIGSKVEKNIVNSLQQHRGNFYVQDIIKHIQASKGKGQPLKDKTRKEMEEKLGERLNDARIHTGSDADQLCKNLGAKAFTSEGELFFREGAFSPETKEGKRLLSHELAHIVQQKGGAASPLSWIDADLAVTFRLEKQAERAAALIQEGKPEELSARSLSAPGPTPSIQMQKEGTEAEEPPKMEKDPRETLQEILKKWTKEKKGKIAISHLKTAALTEQELPEEVVKSITAKLSGMFANEMKVPKGAFELNPEIELGEEGKLKLSPVWKGTPGKSPKEWGGEVTLTMKWK